MPCMVRMIMLIAITILVGQIGALHEPVLNRSIIMVALIAILIHSNEPPTVSGKNRTAYRIRSKIHCVFSENLAYNASMRTIAPFFMAYPNPKTAAQPPMIKQVPYAHVVGWLNRFLEKISIKKTTTSGTNRYAANVPDKSDTFSANAMYRSPQVLSSF